MFVKRENSGHNAAIRESLSSLRGRRQGENVLVSGKRDQQKKEIRRKKGIAIMTEKTARGIRV